MITDTSPSAPLVPCIDRRGVIMFRVRTRGGMDYESLDQIIPFIVFLRERGFGCFAPGSFYPLVFGALLFFDVIVLLFA